MQVLCKCYASAMQVPCKCYATAMQMHKWMKNPEKGWHKMGKRQTDEIGNP